MSEKYLLMHQKLGRAKIREITEKLKKRIHKEKNARIATTTSIVSIITL